MQKGEAEGSEIHRVRSVFLFVIAQERSD